MKNTLLLMLIFLLVLVAAGTWIVCRTPESNIEHVTVRGILTVVRGESTVDNSEPGELSPP